MLSIVILAVDDLARAVAFYERAFGWEAVVRAPAYVELAAGAANVGLYAREGFARNVGEAPGRATPLTATELYLRVPDLAAACARLDAAGARPLSPAGARPWGETVAYYADPDGNVLAVAG
jgi:catechol 2,3-dioxygenase-like lactoylglutathione lyase family enzyme